MSSTTPICSHYFPEESGLSILFCAAVTYFYIDVHNSLFLFGGGSQDEPAFKRHADGADGRIPPSFWQKENDRLNLPGGLVTRSFSFSLR
jgi:hypothetical protein